MESLLLYWIALFLTTQTFHDLLALPNNIKKKFRSLTIITINNETTEHKLEISLNSLSLECMFQGRKFQVKV